jgi:hypothetical protein
MTPDDVAKAFETQLVAALAPKATNADFDKLRQFIEKVPGPDAAQACLRRYLELFGKHENTTTRSRTLATFYLVLKRRIEIVVPLDAMYIEALPGAHPILENFKLLHRQIDAADAQGEPEPEENGEAALRAAAARGRTRGPERHRPPCVRRRDRLDGVATGADPGRRRCAAVTPRRQGPPPAPCDTLREPGAYRGR